jgi:hypothetical protein
VRRAAAAAVLAVLAALLAGLVLAGRDNAVEATPERVRLDLSTSKGKDAAFLRDFERSALVLGAGVDAIPAIDAPRFDSADDAAELLQPESLVVGVEIAGDARAYPTNLLSLHEVVNDEIGGTPVVVTWCPLCVTALAFERRLEGRELTFGVSGYLYSRNLMLFDRATGSLWSQLLGGAVTGEHRGTKLRGVPIVHETWAAWRSKHPNTRVLSFERDQFAPRFTDPGTIEGDGGESTDAPFEAYLTKVPYYYRARQGALSGAARVYGIVLRGRAKAYPLRELRRRGVVRDEVAGVPVVIRYDDESFSAAAFARGAQLPGTFSFWFAWRSIYPSTTVYSQPTGAVAP